MLDDLYRLRSWYPVVPAPEGITGNYGTDTSGLPPWYIAGMIDMRVVVPLATIDVHTDLIHGFYTLLMSLRINSTGTNAVCVKTVVPTTSGNIEIEQTLPVYYSDSAANTSENYVIVDKSMRGRSVSVSDIGAMISNECVFIKQTPPSLYVHERLPDSSDTAVRSTDKYSLASVESGNNINITFYNDILTLRGGAGLGLGIHYKNPFTDSIVMNRRCGKGMRSISGIQDSVTISADASVKIATSTTVDASGDVSEVKLTVRPSSAAAADSL